MRISDWSSDVCSSDLNRLQPGRHRTPLSGPLMAADASRHAHRGTVECHSMLIHERGVLRIGAGKADHPPADHVAIAAVGRIGAEALYGVGKQRLEEYGRVDPLELDGAGRDRKRGGGGKS